MDSQNEKQLKLVVGNAIFAFIQPKFGANTGKLTGMLLERPDFVQVGQTYLENPQFLSEQVDLAHRELVKQEHQ